MSTESVPPRSSEPPAGPESRQRPAEDALVGGRERRFIELVDYDPEWPSRFEAEHERISRSLGRLALQIDHIGSTAVPGLAARPIIDVQVVVTETLSAT